MVFVLECGRTKIDEPNLRVQKDLPLCSLAAYGRGRRRNLPVVRESLIVILAEQNILRLQVGMDEVEIMEDYRWSAGIQHEKRDERDVQATLVNN